MARGKGRSEGRELVGEAQRNGGWREAGIRLQGGGINGQVGRQEGRRGEWREGARGTGGQMGKEAWRD